MVLDMETKIYSLFLYLTIAPILGFLIKSWRNKRGAFYKISLTLFWFTFIFMTLWEFLIFVQLNLLYEFLLLLSLSLAPVLFLILILFHIYYGIRSIIKQDTYIKLFILPIQLKRPLTVYFGVVFLVTGLFLLVFWGGAMSIFLCKDNNIFCPLLSPLDKLLSTLGKLVEFIIIPIKPILDLNNKI